MNAIDLQGILDAMGKLESFNRADSVIANAAREALDDIRALLDSWGELPGVGWCYKTNCSPAELPDLERLRQLLGREEAEQ